MPFLYKHPPNATYQHAGRPEILAAFGYCLVGANPVTVFMDDDDPEGFRLSVPTYAAALAEAYEHLYAGADPHLWTLPAPPTFPER